MAYTASTAEPLMTVRDLAQYLQKSEAWVYRKSRSGELPTIMVGRSRRFDPVAIKAWLRDRTIDSDRHATTVIDFDPDPGRRGN